jgi:Domain of unknown function (DUF4384)
MTMRRALKTGLVTGVGLGLAACALAANGIGPLVPIILQLGAELISKSSQNYSKEYSSDVERLLLAMYANKTGYAGPVPGAGGYAQGPAPNPAYPGAAAGGPYPQDSAAYAPPPAQYSAQASQPPQYGTPQGAQPQYGTPAYGQSPAAASAAPIVLDATILAQRATDRSAYRMDPVPIQDGETLRDGGSDPRQGDALKFSFRVNCDCYVYVIGVDATGYIARIYPDLASGHMNPVRAQQQYVVPGGASWYGLDQTKGVEQVFFMASRYPRPDIEGSLARLALTPRSSLSRSYSAVRKAGLPSSSTRGLVKMQMGTTSSVQGESGQQYTFTPQAFGTQPGADSIIVARWFNHQ